MNDIDRSKPEAAALPLRRDLPFKAVGNEALVRDPESGRVHFLNTAAMLVWECCDGVTSYRECALKMRNTFAIPESADIQADIFETLEGFRRLGILHD